MKVRQGAEATAAAWGVCLLLAFGLLTLWVRERWAVAAFQSGFMALGLGLLVWRVVRPFPLPGGWVLWPLAGLAGWAGVQIALGTTVHRFTTWDAMTEYAAYLSAAGVMLVALSRRETRRTMRSVWLWGAALIAAQALLQVMTGEGKAFWVFETGYENEVLGPFVYKNKFAQFAEMVMPLALYKGLAGGVRSRVYLVPAAVMFSAVVASGSRSGVILLILELFAVLAVCWRRGLIGGRRAGWISAAATGLFVLWGTLAGWELLFERLLTLDPLSDYRWPVMASSLQMARDHLWTGSGMGTWPLVYPAYASFDIGVVVNQAHCDWLQWLGEGGIVMLALMTWLLAGLALRAWGSVWGMGLLFVMAHAAVDYPFHQLPAFTTFVILTAMLAGAERDEAAA
ncbi:MAG: O-antigen ligase family protein [Bryobacteraceae bacterium]|nr:O-antigen ligase family protein [Bryobacteraceae bacterium]